MRSLTRCLISSFSRYPEVTHALGRMGEPKDLKGKELDQFRRYIKRVHYHHAGKESPNF